MVYIFLSQGKVHIISQCDKNLNLYILFFQGEIIRGQNAIPYVYKRCRRHCRCMILYCINIVIRRSFLIFLTNSQKDGVRNYRHNADGIIPAMKG